MSKRMETTVKAWRTGLTKEDNTAETIGQIVQKTKPQPACFRKSLLPAPDIWAHRPSLPPSVRFDLSIFPVYDAIAIINSQSPRCDEPLVPWEAILHDTRR